MEQDNVNHPAHYEKGFETRTVECIDITRHLPFALGNAVKYVWRAGKKGDLAKAVEDLDKAQWYADEWMRQSEDMLVPVGLEIAQEIFRLVIEPENRDSVEWHRYEAIAWLLDENSDLFDINGRLESLEEALEKEAKKEAAK